MTTAAPATGTSAVAVAVAVAVARYFAVALRLLTSPAVKRAEHRSGTGGEEAHVFERSELCAVPPFREERRGPMRRSRIGSRPAVLSFGYFFFARAKKSNSLPEGERKPLTLPWPLRALLPLLGKEQSCSKGFHSCYAGASHVSLLVQRNVAQRKHALPTRPTRCARGVHSAAGIFRHDIPVVSKNDVHPCTSPFGFFPSAPSLRKGARQIKSRSNSQGNRNRNRNRNRPNTFRIPSIAPQGLTAPGKSS